MVSVGLETIQSQDDVTLLFEELLETGLIGKAQREQFFVALQKVGDGALGNGNATLLQRTVDLGNGAMLAVAQGPNQGDDVKTKLAVGQSPGAFLFWANGLAVTRARGIVAAADAQGQAGDMLKGRDGASGVVASPERATTV